MPSDISEREEKLYEQLLKIESKKNNKYKHFKDEPRKSSQDVIDMINKYLDEWEALAEQVPAQVKANVADIS